MGERVRQHLRTAEVARLLGVSTQTVYNWLRTNKVREPERHPLTGYRLWTVEDVERLRNSILEARNR